MADQTDLLALFGIVGPQLFAQAAFIAANNVRGGGQNMRGRAVVLLQPHDVGAGEILFKPQDIAHLGPAPAIDRLVIVTDATDVLVPSGQQTQPEVLGDVGILILVHKDVAEPALILLQRHPDGSGIS